MPNLFRHLIIPRTYETLKQVQGDKIVITTQSLVGEGQGEGEYFTFKVTPPPRHLPQGKGGFVG
jgi:hypothetical protein